MMKKITVVGFGNAGIRILDHLAQRAEGVEGLNLVAVDTDAETLGAVRSPNVKKIEAAFNWTEGHGTGGSLLSGERCVAEIRDSVLKEIDPADAVVLIGGVGGGTASGGLPLLRRALLRQRKPVIVLAMTPFSFEGEQCHTNAITAIQDLSKADVLLQISGDLLFASIPHDTPAKTAFAAADESLAMAAYGVCRMLQTDPLIPAGYPNLKALLSGKRAAAGVGVAFDRNPLDPDRFLNLFHDIALSPLLGGPEFLKQANAVLCILTGGTELSIGEVRKAFDNLRVYFSPEASMVTGITTDEKLGDNIQLTVIALRYDKNAAAAMEGRRRAETSVTRTAARMRAQRPIVTRSTVNEQPELPLQELSRGIFGNAPITPFDGADLDFPTYQRQHVLIEPGR